jgi:hypothetical protein
LHTVERVLSISFWQDQEVFEQISEPLLCCSVIKGRSPFFWPFAMTKLRGDETSPSPHIDLPPVTEEGSGKLWKKFHDAPLVPIGESCENESRFREDDFEIHGTTEDKKIIWKFCGVTSLNFGLEGGRFLVSIN